jgi:hypothetical protein
LNTQINFLENFIYRALIIDSTFQRKHSWKTGKGNNIYLRFTLWHAMSEQQQEKTTVPLQVEAQNSNRTAWLTVLGCFLAFFATFGIVTGFGVFQAYFELLWPDRSASDISWIGSFQLWSITGMAIPSVILSSHVGPHWTLGLGTLMTVFGVMMASISTTYYQVLLSYGICTGLGVGLTFMPLIGLPNQWFTTKRGLAVGLSLGGSSIGGVVWSVMFDQMINDDHLGYPWTMRVIGFVQVSGRESFSMFYVSKSDFRLTYCH